MRTLALTLLLLAASRAPGQEIDTPRTSLALAPPDVRFAILAADSILTTVGGEIGLEAFRADTTTGVYLRGSYGGSSESVGYGIDADGKRYLWFSIGRGDSLDYVAMLFDVDLDLTPEFLLFRAIDRGTRVETAIEYRAPAVMGLDFDITFQPACVAPRCDPATWAVHEREVVLVPAVWFAAWRPLYGVAAMRGERWLGRPVRELHARAGVDP